MIIYEEILLSHPPSIEADMVVKTPSTNPYPMYAPIPAQADLARMTNSIARRALTVKVRAVPPNIRPISPKRERVMKSRLSSPSLAVVNEAMITPTSRDMTVIMRAMMRRDRVLAPKY